MSEDDGPELELPKIGLSSSVRTLPSTPSRELGRGRGRGSARIGGGKSPREEAPQPGEASGDGVGRDAQKPVLSGMRSPPAIRTWTRTGTPGDRPVSGPAEVTSIKVRSDSIIGKKIGLERKVPSVDAPLPPLATPPSVNVIPTSLSARSSSGVNDDSNNSDNDTTTLDDDPFSEQPVESATTRLSKKTLQRLSKQLNVPEMKRRGDTFKSLDSRVAEALRADNETDSRNEDGGEEASHEMQVDNEPQKQEEETNDQVWVWGNRGIDVVAHPTPQRLPDLGSKNVKQVCAGYAHMIMILENGATYTWGCGKDGRLGHGKNSDGVDLREPARVEGLAAHNVKFVAAGGTCSVALTVEGVLYFWGWLGIEEALRFVSPTPVEGFERMRIISAACGECHILALTQDHSVYSWGVNRFGSLGQGRREGEYVNLPRLVLPNQEFIAAGPNSGASISTKGLLSYWGPNFKKKDKDKSIKKPEKINHKGRLVGVALGAQHMLMVDDQGEVYVMGEGADGQLGTGNYTPQMEPVKVEFPLSKEEKQQRARALKEAAAAASSEGGTLNNSGGTVGTARPTLASPGASTKTLPSVLKKPRATPSPPPGASGANSNSPIVTGTVREGATPTRQIKLLAAGTSSSLAVSKEGTLFVWGKIDSKGTESFLQPTVVRALDKISIDQVSAAADQMVALVGLKNERDIRYFSFNPPIVKAASLSKLVDRLLSDKVHQDPLYAFSFFASHDIFSSSVDVINELYARYEKARSSDGSKVQLRLLAVLAQWMKVRPYDFRSAATKKAMEEFLNKIEQASQVRSLRKAMEPDEVQEKPLNSTPTTPWQFAKYTNTLEVAQQLVLVDKYFFERIKPLPELTHQNWMKTAKRDVSPNVLSFIARFNEFFYFIVTDVLVQEETPVRTVRFHYWTEVFRHCLNIGNLNAAVCIASALNSVPIRKLAKRELLVINPKDRQALEDFRKLLSDRNKTGYRDMLNARIDNNEPAIPYMAFMLSDLTFIEEGNKNVLPDGLIHFYKFHLIGKTLSAVDELQKRPFTGIQPDEPLMSALAGCRGLDEETCDKVAEAICAGDSVKPFMEMLEDAAKGGALKGSRSDNGGGGGGGGGGSLDNSASSGSLTARARGGSSGKADDSQSTEALIAALNAEAQCSAEKRMDVWNGWLTRYEKEGDDFRALLTTSAAFTHTLDSVLLDPLKKPEVPLFQQLLAKFLSPTVNVRAVVMVLQQVSSVTGVFSDIREEVVRLFVLHEYNAILEAAAAGKGVTDTAEDDERRKALRPSVICDGVDWDSLDAKTESAMHDTVTVLALPVLANVCDYDGTSLESIVDSRVEQVDGRITALESGSADSGEMDTQDGEVPSMDDLKDRLSELRLREQELEEALRLCRDEIANVERLMVQKEQKGSGGAATNAHTQEALEQEIALKESLSTAKTSLKNYLDKVYGPRRAKMVTRREKHQEAAVEKGGMYSEALEAIKEAVTVALEQRAGEQQFDAGGPSPTPAEATLASLKGLFHLLKRSFLSVSEILREVSVDYVVVSESLIREIEKQLKGI